MKRTAVPIKATGWDVCNPCGQPGGAIRSYYSLRARNEGEAAPGWATFVSGDHKACVATVERAGHRRHPGHPAWFAGVCGGCKHRYTEEGRVAVCVHPSRREAGGGGLRARRSEGDPMSVVSCSGREAA